MKDATKCGVAQAAVKHSVCFTAPCMSCSSFKGSSQSKNHRRRRSEIMEYEIARKENIIIFDESCCKTYRGGLDDLKTDKPRHIEHECHAMGEVPYPLSSNYLSPLH
jgi:hypothetical protein